MPTGQVVSQSEKFQARRRGRYSKPTAQTAIRLATGARTLSGCALLGAAGGIRTRVLRAGNATRLT